MQRAQVPLEFNKKIPLRRDISKAMPCKIAKFDRRNKFFAITMPA